MAMEEEEYADVFRVLQRLDEKPTDEEGSSDKSKCSDESMILEQEERVSVRSSTESKSSDESMILEQEERVSVRSSTKSKSSMILEQEERVSVRSSTESDQSMTGETEVDDYAMKLGTKRKAAIEEAEDDDSVYDSSDDDYNCESDVSKEEEEDSENHDSVPLVGSDGLEITNEEILDWMRPDSRSLEEKKKLLPKIRRYLSSIRKNQGFDCTDYPGYVSGVTQFIPRQIVIDHRVRYPEGYNHLMYMGSLALKYYNEKHGAKFSIKAVEKVMISISKGTIYYLTLTATSGLISQTFQADVWDNTIDMEMEVAFCRPMSSSTVEQLLPANSTERESNQSTPGEAWFDKRREEADKYTGGNERSNLVTQISRIKAMSNPAMLELIRNRKCSAGKDEGKLVLKVHKYLTSLLQSEGFKCANFPGRILDITIVTPRQKIIDQMNYFPECYDQLFLMAKLALDYYLKDKGTELKLKVSRVQTANLWRETDCCYTYYITFTSLDLIGREEMQTFEAEVQDRQHFIKIISCRPAAVM
ncbi:hypothetical protein OROMI_027679 [Orobanche minor]